MKRASFEASFDLVSEAAATLTAALETLPNEQRTGFIEQSGVALEAIVAVGNAFGRVKRYADAESWVMRLPEPFRAIAIASILGEAD